LTDYLRKKEVIRVQAETDPSGQGMLEYAMIMALVAIVVVVVLALFGPAIGDMFSNVVTNV
jgi:pilus assembly protein Flp/PilA